MEASEPPAQVPQEASLISKIRNMWEFASVNQFMHTFGKAVKLDNDFDIEVRDQFHCLPSPTATASRTAMHERPYLLIIYRISKKNASSLITPKSSKTSVSDC